MKKIILFIVLAGLCLFFKATAHDKPDTSGLKIGDQVPDITINNILNYKGTDGKPATTAKISDFKGKLLILDFWNTWCLGCIESMPNISKSEMEFGSQVQFISVTNQPLGVIKRFLNKNQPINNLKLTMAVDDKQLSNLFPYRLVPHIIWISKEGMYIGATSQEDINSKNISQILATGKSKFSEPKVDLLDFDVNKPLFIDKNGGIPDGLYKSQLTKYQEGLPSQEGTNEYENKKRIYALNTDLFELYCKALSVQTYQYPDSKIEYKNDYLKHSFRYHPNSKKAESLYCYELIYSGGEYQKVHKIMLNDLNTWFDTNVKIEKRKTNCYVLYISGQLRFHSKDSIGTNNLKVVDGANKYIRGQWLQTLVDYMNSLPEMKPVIDETGYNEKVDLDLNNDITNIGELNKYLSKYGLVFREEIRKLDIMVVSPASEPNKL